jgi:hypothetical protein
MGMSTTLTGRRTAAGIRAAARFQPRQCIGPDLKRKAMFCALAVTALAGLTLPATAQDQPGRNVATVTGKTATSSVFTMALAHDLYSLGSAQGDALTVLAAAELARSAEGVAAEPSALDPANITFDGGEPEHPANWQAPVPTTPSSPAPIAAGTARPAAKLTLFSTTSEDEGTATAPASAMAMFAKATELAGDDAIILGLIKEAQGEDAPGPVGRANFWQSNLAAGRADIWELPFHEGGSAEIAVLGGGDSNLDITVTDQSGNVICKDVSWSDTLYCDWTPAWDGLFYVTVQNTGGARNTYHLVTN